MAGERYSSACAFCGRCDAWEDDADRQAAIAAERDFVAMVEAFRSALPDDDDYAALSSLALAVGRILKNPRLALSHKLPWVAFAEDYGTPALLRALALAIERHEARAPRPSAEVAS